MENKMKTTTVTLTFTDGSTATRDFRGEQRARDYIYSETSGDLGIWVVNIQLTTSRKK